MNPEHEISRDDLADRMLDLALAEKVGGKTPPDLAARILARAAEPVELAGRPADRSGRARPAAWQYLVSGCALALAALAAVILRPDLTVRPLAKGPDATSDALLTEEQKQDRLVELVERFNRLMDEERFADAAAVAQRAKDFDPDSGVADYMLEKSRFLARVTSDGITVEGNLLKAFEEQEGKFLGSVENAKRIITEKIRAEVEDGLAKARKDSGGNPESAKAHLRLLLDNIERAVDLEGDVRGRLREQTESALKEATRREVEFAEKRANNEEAKAAALESQLLDPAPIVDAQKNLQRAQQYAGYSKRLAAKAYGTREQLAGDSLAVAKAKRELAMARGLVAGSSDRDYALLPFELPAVRVWNGQQRSEVPYPNNPAVEYSEGRVWQELTQRQKSYYSADGKTPLGYAPSRSDAMSDYDFAKLVRKTDALHQLAGVRTRLEERRDQLAVDGSKYKKQLDIRGINLNGRSDERSMELGKRGSAETKILAELSNPTTFEFAETPLKDVVEYLKDLHGIEIQIDAEVLDGVGVDSGAAVTRTSKGVTLNSALQAILKDIGLAYTVCDEVLHITTPEKAKRNDTFRATKAIRDEIAEFSDEPGLHSVKLQGEVAAVSKKNGKLVEISLGSDDGVRVGRVLDVLRGARPLGRLIVVRTTPDRAVAQLLASIDGGPIEPGDRVASLNKADLDPSGDKFDLVPENSFERVAKAPLSTFSIDVDTASYSKIRQFLLAANQLPPPEAVRLEEMINYFPYNYPPPADGRPFAAHVEAVACPWNDKHRLVRIGLKGKVIEAAQRPASNLVFLVDVSGSMDEPNKLPLVIQGLKLLAGELTDRDMVSIVVYAGAAGMVLPPTRGDAKPTIYTALTRLQAGGSTNGAEGIELAYKTAQENFIEGGVNRVVLCTDGDFNVGVTSTGGLVDLAVEKAQKGVFLSVLGFGMGNHNDEMLEAVSNKANGNYAFIDSLAEARKVLVRQISGTLVTIAKDVKIQVEFNPRQVASYRLLGYEDRMLAAEDFNNDKKDAGEIGGGHTVTALYEVILAGGEEPAAEKPLHQPAAPARTATEKTPADESTGKDESKDTAQKQDIDDLRYQPTGKAAPADAAGELLTLKLRYKEPTGETSTKLEFPMKDSGRRFTEAPADFQFAAAVASFGMLLKRSQHKGNATFDAVLEIATAAKGDDPHGYRAEFLEMVKQAKLLGGAKMIAE